MKRCLTCLHHKRHRVSKIVSIRHCLSQNVVLFRPAVFERNLPVYVRPGDHTHGSHLFIDIIDRQPYGHNFARR